MLAKMVSKQLGKQHQAQQPAVAFGVTIWQINCWQLSIAVLENDGHCKRLKDIVMLLFGGSGRHARDQCSAAASSSSKLWTQFISCCHMLDQAEVHHTLLSTAVLCNVHAKDSMALLRGCWP